MIPYPSENVKRNLPLPPTRHSMITHDHIPNRSKSLIFNSKLFLYFGHDMPYNGLIGLRRSL